MTRARDVAGFISNISASGKNFLINGGFDHFQRGTASQRIQAGQWWADRWTPGLFQVGRHQRVALGYVNSELNSPYALRVGSSNLTEDSNGTRMKAAQTIESSNSLPLAGKKVTLSYWVKFSSATFTSISNLAGGGNSSFSNFNPYIAYYTSTTDGATGSTFPDSSTGSPIVNGSLPTTWTKYTITGTVPTNAKNVGVVFEFGTLGSTTTSDALFYDIAQVQLEIGSVATTFSRAGGSIGAELALCQRYYCKMGGDSAFGIIGPGIATNTNSAAFIVNLPVPMRVSPNITEYSTLGVTDLTAINSPVTSLSLVTTETTRFSARMDTGVSSGGLTQFRPMFLRNFNSSSGYLAFGAEF